ncbi:DUF4395 domain-containing protein [Saccharopolyspora sp. HNM0983]|uniref:DUF4395 domain-containing protein n=1 Tax=Saccharopolyspora montiporae TaxID=2781240 RepID=A0A929BAZ4_9PSEU|nr:DUF4395 domain-containing protein [Saccharopolyspora sp. HNM0983]MBE9374788.1 DUF4395 domain-containing protein [Saccharopolyspora sp. HNM0983]
MRTTPDPRGVRFTAAFTSAVLALGLVTGSWRVMAAQTLLFGLCAFVDLKLNPWGALYRRAVQPRLAALGGEQHEAPGPVRFAQGIGFVFCLVATAGYASGAVVIGAAANALALLAALLNAVFGYCLGCRAHALAHRMAPARSSAAR